MLRFGNKLKVGLLGLVLVVASVFAFTSFTKQSEAATSCDKVNIVKCGLAGSSVQDYINDIATLNRTGTDGYGHNDMEFMLNWGGFTDQVIAGMNTSNTKIGTLYRNGDIYVDGKVVATGSWITARFTNGNGFKQITTGVWARLSSTSMMNASDQVVVTFDANGKAIAGTVIRCGNMLQFTPVEPAPVKVCNPADGTIISVPASQASNYPGVDSPKCKDLSVCRLSDKQIVTIKQAVYDNNPSAYSTNPLDCQPPVKVCNPNSGTIETVPAKDAGNYLPVDSEKCKVSVCDPSDHTIKLVPKSDEEKYLPASSDKCQQMSVCNKLTNELNITIYKDQFDASKYSTNPADCTPVQVCVLNDKPNTKIIKKSELDLSKYSLDVANCTVTPPLPSTGPAEVVSGLFGTSALGYGAYSYLASRRAVKHIR